MASKTITILIDDVDGGTAESRVAFSVGKNQYEIDLSAENLKAFNEALEPWVEYARKIPSTRRRNARAAAARPSGVDQAVVREWAQQNGMAVSDRGRLADAVYEAYEQANPAK